MSSYKNKYKRSKHSLTSTKYRYICPHIDTKADRPAVGGGIAERKKIHEAILDIQEVDPAVKKQGWQILL